MADHSKIDRTKFDRRGMMLTSWNSNTRKWFCAWWPRQDMNGPPQAAGEGDDPAEAFIAMLVDLRALQPGGTLQ